MKLVYNAELAFVTFLNLVLANNNTFQRDIHINTDLQHMNG